MTARRLKLFLALTVLAGCIGKTPPRTEPTAPDAIQSSPRLSVVPGRVPYTGETEGHLLFSIPKLAWQKDLSLEAKIGDQVLIPRSPVLAGRSSLPLPLASLPEGASEILCELFHKEQSIAQETVKVWKLPPKANEVKIDHMSRGLLVDDRPFFPMGFYCRPPLGTLPEDEAVNGFNTLIPFDYATPPKKIQPVGHTPEQMAETRKQMDRCAALGMKVHYDIKIIAQEPSSEDKWRILKSEIDAFKDHPALLAWYICDEPTGWKIPPELLEETYRFVKEADPYHPVTMVFCDPKRVAPYAKATDILVADPYPIPTLPITTVSQWCDRIRNEASCLQPLWIVPQAFGGGEWWAREPSAQEERVMTYLALIHGATGIEYFIRVPTMGHPKSPSLWSECRRLALEIAELKPDLLSILPAPEVTCSPKSVHARAWVNRGTLTLLVVNTENRPLKAHLWVPGNPTGEAEVLFENRNVKMQWGTIEEMIEAFGTRVYRIPWGSPSEETLGIHPLNIAVNPSFEEYCNVGTPDGCYFTTGKDRGASGFLDSQMSCHGRRSLRLISPAEGEGVNVRPFRLPLEKDQAYVLSIWAKGKTPGLVFEMTLHGVDAGTQRFTLSEEWQEYRLTGTATEKKKSNLSFKLLSPGTAWFDLLQVYPNAP